MRWVLHVHPQGCAVFSFRHMNVAYTYVYIFGPAPYQLRTLFEIIARKDRGWQSSCDVLTSNDCFWVPYWGCLAVHVVL